MSSIYVLFGRKKEKTWPIVSSFEKDELLRFSNHIKKEYPTNANSYYVVTLDLLPPSVVPLNKQSKEVFTCKNTGNISNK